MKIVLDATPVGVRTNDKGGVYRYIRQLIMGFAEIDSAHRFRLLFNFCRREHLSAFDEARREFASCGFEIVRGRIPKALWLRGWVPAEVTAGRFDVFHGLYDFVPRVLRGASVLTIHDLRYVTINESEDSGVMRLIQDTPQLLAHYRHRLDFFRQQRDIIGQVARRADLIITPSEYSRRAIVDTLGVPAPRVRVVQHGLADEFRIPLPEERIGEVLTRHGVLRPYLLFVGKMDPLKNLETLLRAFATVRREHDVQLVLAGETGWYGAVLRQRIAELGIGEDVRFLQHITDADLKALYQGAELMVFPSLFEGFGLPVLEAMASGTPVVCSNHCSLPEVAGDAALLLDPSSQEAIASAVLEVLGDSDLRERLRQAGIDRSSEFTWRDTARQTLRAYEQAAAG